MQKSIIKLPEITREQALSQLNIEVMMKYAKPHFLNFLEQRIIEVKKYLEKLDDSDAFVMKVDKNDFEFELFKAMELIEQRSTRPDIILTKKGYEYCRILYLSDPERYKEMVKDGVKQIRGFVVTQFNAKIKEKKLLKKRKKEKAKKKAQRRNRR